MSMPLAEAGRYQWNVFNNPPGLYTAAVTFRDRDTGAVADSTDTSFEILPTIALRTLRVSLSKDVVEGGDILPLPITVAIGNAANVTATWQILWQLRGPNGAVVASSSVAEEVEILGTQLSTNLTLAEPISGYFSATGRYTLEVTCQRDGSDAISALAHFNILPGLHLNVQNAAEPAEVSPLGQARVKTVLRLAAGNPDDDLALPVAINKLVLTPNEEIVDADISAIAFAATGIVNVVGSIVPDGTPLLVYVPYGTIIGGAAVPEAMANTQVQLFEVQNGNIQFQYKPRGGVLSSGQHSVTIVEFHQYLPDAANWYGRNIGNAEVFLRGP